MVVLGDALLGVVVLVASASAVVVFSNAKDAECVEGGGRTTTTTSEHKADIYEAMRTRDDVYTYGSGTGSEAFLRDFRPGPDFGFLDARPFAGDDFFVFLRALRRRSWEDGGAGALLAAIMSVMGISSSDESDSAGFAFGFQAVATMGGRS